MDIIHISCFFYSSKVHKKFLEIYTGNSYNGETRDKWTQNKCLHLLLCLWGPQNMRM